MVEEMSTDEKKVKKKRLTKKDLEARIDELEQQVVALTSQNAQLGEILKITKDQVAQKIYDGWYLAGIKQGLKLFTLEADRIRLNEIKKVLDKEILPTLKVAIAKRIITEDI